MSTAESDSHGNPRPLSSPEYAVQAVNVTKTYTNGYVGVNAVRGISVAIPCGQMVAIMGPSGSGKSTLLHMLGGLERPTSGQVFIDGSDIAKYSESKLTVLRRQKLGFVFQTFNLLSVLNTIENVALPLLLDGVDSGNAYSRAEESIREVGLDHRRNTLVNRLSGGERQRVAVARALTIQPTLILADEPTGNLDSVNGEQLMHLFCELVHSKGQTVVMVTHDANIAAYADRMIVIQDGRVAEDVTVKSHSPAIEEDHQDSTGNGSSFDV
ncbi:ABC transporter ATP-binding protein [Bremerella cremea]|uniref:Lipoprotein-releasing system ATP-binding protein LolD n=1 Tax=Blastopirellula marina TaxID=124 RepID=A0A2S8G091_9BACT|nr:MULTISPECIES: ABC transporter ATP-binding protein [Pirellulaceae]PQO37858.1 lipoprotein-releasing system ATP-binding protein LolD [Blastopirellula marina]RCS50246.1 ABC transporter ATP-binding protein [Bremerella cremea]